MPLWGKSQKNPTDVVKAIKDGLAVLEKGDKKSDKVGMLGVTSGIASICLRRGNCQREPAT